MLSAITPPEKHNAHASARADAPPQSWDDLCDSTSAGGQEIYQYAASTIMQPGSNLLSATRDSLLFSPPSLPINLSPLRGLETQFTCSNVFQECQSGNAENGTLQLAEARGSVRMANTDTFSHGKLDTSLNSQSSDGTAVQVRMQDHEIAARLDGFAYGKNKDTGCQQLDTQHVHAETYTDGTRVVVNKVTGEKLVWSESGSEGRSFDRAGKLVRTFKTGGVAPVSIDLGDENLVLEGNNLGTIKIARGNKVASMSGDGTTAIADKKTGEQLLTVSGANSVRMAGGSSINADGSFLSMAIRATSDDPVEKVAIAEAAIALAQSKANEMRGLLNSGALNEGSRGELESLRNQLGSMAAGFANLGMCDMVGRLQAAQGDLGQVTTQVQNKLDLKHVLVATTGAGNVPLLNEVMGRNPASQAEAITFMSDMVTRYHIPPLTLVHPDAKMSA
jgi:hypothetical protein